MFVNCVNFTQIICTPTLHELRGLLISGQSQILLINLNFQFHIINQLTALLYGKGVITRKTVCLFLNLWKMFDNPYNILKFLCMCLTQQKMIDFCYKNSSISIFSCGTLCKWSQSYSATDYSRLWKMFHNPYENYPILIYDMTIISLVVYTGVYPLSDVSQI